MSLSPDDQAGTDRPGPFSIVRALVAAQVECELSLDMNLWDDDIVAQRHETLLPVVAQVLTDAGYEANNRDLILEMIDFAVDDLDRERNFARQGIDDPCPELVWSAAFGTPEYRREMQRVRVGMQTIKQAFERLGNPRFYEVPRTEALTRHPRPRVAAASRPCATAGLQHSPSRLPPRHRIARGA